MAYIQLDLNLSDDAGAFDRKEYMRNYMRAYMRPRRMRIRIQNFINAINHIFNDGSITSIAKWHVPKLLIAFMFSKDHKKPRCKGGDDSDENKTPVTTFENSVKMTNTPEVAIEFFKRVWHPINHWAIHKFIEKNPETPDWVIGEFEIDMDYVKAGRRYIYLLNARDKMAGRKIYSNLYKNGKVLLTDKQIKKIIKLLYMLTCWKANGYCCEYSGIPVPIYLVIAMELDHIIPKVLTYNPDKYDLREYADGELYERLLPAFDELKKIRKVAYDKFERENLTTLCDEFKREKYHEFDDDEKFEKEFDRYFEKKFNRHFMKQAKFKDNEFVKYIESDENKALVLPQANQIKRNDPLKFAKEFIGEYHQKCEGVLAEWENDNNTC